MARKRRFTGRPIDHLQLAARAHAVVADGPTRVPEEAPPAAAAPEHPQQSQRARAQRRDVEGRFA